MQLLCLLSVELRLLGALIFASHGVCDLAGSQLSASHLLTLGLGWLPDVRRDFVYIGRALPHRQMVIKFSAFLRLDC